MRLNRSLAPFREKTSKGKLQNEKETVEKERARDAESYAQEVEQLKQGQKDNVARLEAVITSLNVGSLFRFLLNKFVTD